MSNYFDNQSRWSWTNDGKSVKVTTDHGSHTHTLDISNATIEDMYNNCGETMGNAHRATSHDEK